MEQRCDALLLRSVDYGEADRIVTFLTPDMGKIAMFAHGARRSQRRFGGALEPFQNLHLIFRDRGASSLSTLTSAEVLKSRSLLMADYDLITLASYLTELVGETLRERDPAPAPFEALTRAYDTINSEEFMEFDADARVAWLAAVELRVLSIAGYEPLLSSCADCGTTDPSGTFRFQAERGGLLCETCSRRSGVPLRLATAQALAATLTSGEVPDLDEKQAYEARRALGSLIRYQLGKELKSARFLK